MISNCGDGEPNAVSCIQRFNFPAPQLELAILSKEFRITEHAQSSVVKYFSFFSAEFS